MLLPSSCRCSWWPTPTSKPRAIIIVEVFWSSGLCHTYSTCYYRSDGRFLATSSSLRVSTSRLPRPLTLTKAISIIVLVHFKSSQLFPFSKRCGGTFHLCGNATTRVTCLPFTLLNSMHKQLFCNRLPAFHHYHHELYPFSHSLATAVAPLFTCVSWKNIVITSAFNVVFVS